MGRRKLALVGVVIAVGAAAAAAYAALPSRTVDPGSVAADPRLLALVVATLLVGGVIGILVGARVFPTRTVKTRTAVDNVTHTETVIRLVGSPRPRTLLV